MVASECVCGRGGGAEKTWGGGGGRDWKGMETEKARTTSQNKNGYHGYYNII